MENQELKGAASEKTKRKGFFGFVLSPLPFAFAQSALCSLRYAWLPKHRS